MSGTDDKKAAIDLACSTAENFSKLFYDKMDNKRHTISKMYLETATASWNGNKVGLPSCSGHLWVGLPGTSCSNDNHYQVLD